MLILQNATINQSHTLKHHINNYTLITDIYQITEKSSIGYTLTHYENKPDKFGIMTLLSY